MAEAFKQFNIEGEYVIDSFPVTVCDHIRISCCKIYKTEDYREFVASKIFFYGIRIHIIVTKTEQPIEFCLAPVSYNDLRVIKTFDFNLPENSVIYDDKIDNDYQWEDWLK